MGNVTENLSAYEWACRCGCGFADMHPLIVVRLQDIRTAAGKRLDFTSGCRCRDRNRSEGGAGLSYHLPDLHGGTGFARAADWCLRDTTLAEMYDFANGIPEFKRGGVIVYLDGNGARIHVDVRRSGRYHSGRLYGAKVSIATVLKAAAEEGV